MCTSSNRNKNKYSGDIVLTGLVSGQLIVMLCLQVLTVGGSSDHIDVFTNLSYRAFSLRF